MGKGEEGIDIFPFHGTIKMKLRKAVPRTACRFLRRKTFEEQAQKREK